MKGRSKCRIIFRDCCKTHVQSRRPTHLYLDTQKFIPKLILVKLQNTKNKGKQLRAARGEKRQFTQEGIISRRKSWVLHGSDGDCRQQNIKTPKYWQKATIRQELCSVKNYLSQTRGKYFLYNKTGRIYHQQIFTYGICQGCFSSRRKRSPKEHLSYRKNGTRTKSQIYH